MGRAKVSLVSLEDKIPARDIIMARSASDKAAGMEGDRYRFRRVLDVFPKNWTSFNRQCTHQEIFNEEHQIKNDSFKEKKTPGKPSLFLSTHTQQCNAIEETGSMLAVEIRRLSWKYYWWMVSTLLKRFSGPCISEQSIRQRHGLQAVEEFY
jgi:hypothetical protein